MSDEEATYPNNVISKATHMVILDNVITPNKILRLCDYHYNELIDSGVSIVSKSAIIEEFINAFGSEDCDKCLKERK
jgi:hypothetical protein